MSFLGNLFKRKPGGTVIGNLLRTTAKTMTGGFLGNGTMMISQEDADKRDLSDAEFQAKYGKTKNNVILPAMSKLAATNQANAAAAAAAAPNPKWEAFKGWFKQNWWMVVIPTSLLIAVLIAKKVMKKGKHRPRRY